MLVVRTTGVHVVPRLVLAGEVLGRAAIVSVFYAVPINMVEGEVDWQGNP